jgi:signal peptidase I
LSSIVRPRTAELKPGERFARGSVVLVDMSRKNERKLPLKILDGIVRFFPAHRAGIFIKDEPTYLKRVIGLPGDEISMSSFIFRVKPSGSSYSLTEFELSIKPYQPLIPQIPAIWDESIPFSPLMEAIILGPDEYFVISDDRGNTNDSRTWGPVPGSFITGRAVLRFWPFTKFERL